MNGAPPRPQKRAPGRPGACYAGLMRDLFDSRTFGPQPGDQKLSELRRFWRWVRGHQSLTFINPASSVVLGYDLDLGFIGET